MGGYVDAGGANHGFILDGGKFTTVDFAGAAGTILTSVNPSGQMSEESWAAASSATTTHSFVVSKKGVFTSFDPPGPFSSSASMVNPSGAVVGAYTDSGGVGHGYLLSDGTFTTIDFRALRLRSLERITPRATLSGNTTILQALDTLSY